MMLGAVYSFFVAEPKMTAQQVHDTLQAAGNVEALHAREVAAAAAVEGEGVRIPRNDVEELGGKPKTSACRCCSAPTYGGSEFGRDEYDNEREKEKSRLSL